MTGAQWTEIRSIAEIERTHSEELAVLMQEHEAALYRYLVALTGNREVALDCVQDTFTRAYEHLRNGRHLNAQWLYKVGRNRGIDELRRRKREAVDQSALDDVAVTAGSEDMTSLRQAFAALSPDDRAILTLTLAEGLSGEELATRLGIRHGAVRMRLRRARERFRKLYSEGG